jgi:hypothetical protein
MTGAPVVEASCSMLQRTHGAVGISSWLSDGSDGPPIRRGPTRCRPDPTRARSAATVASPAGDEGLRSFDDGAGVGSDHERWGLVTQVRIHSCKPGANRLGFVVFE